MAKFSNAKIGDRVWYVACQSWGRIISIDKEDRYPIRAKGKDWEATFTLDGKYDIDYDYVSLFWNKFHIPTDEEDKKPFDLVEFLKSNTEKVDFEYDEFNYYIYYDMQRNEFALDYVLFSFHIGEVYLKEGNIKNIVNNLNENKVTPEQVKQAYKELGWL